jgi:hypothetical protein
VPEGFPVDLSSGRDSVFSLDAPSTALVLLDLQYGTLALPLQPYSAVQIVEKATASAVASRSSVR